MDQIRFAGSAFLPAVMKRGKEIGTANQVDIGAGPVFFYLFDDVFNPDHKLRPSIFYLLRGVRSKNLRTRE